MSGTQATQIHNARVTLFASLLNTMAGSSFTVGVVAPIAATFFYSPSGLRLSLVVIGVSAAVRIRA